MRFCRNMYTGILAADVPIIGGPPAPKKGEEYDDGEIGFP